MGVLGPPSLIGRWSPWCVLLHHISRAEECMGLVEVPEVPDRCVQYRVAGRKYKGGRTNAAEQYIMLNWDYSVPQRPVTGILETSRQDRRPVLNLTARSVSVLKLSFFRF